MTGGVLSNFGTIDGPFVLEGGRFLPADATTTHVAGYSQSTGAILEVEVGGTVPGSQHHQVVVEQSATLGGELAVVLTDGYRPTEGTLDSAIVLSASGGLGGTTFDTVPSRDRGEGQFLDVAYTANEVIVEVLQASPGDANGDRQFDFDDIFQVLGRAKYASGLAATWGDGDWTSDLVFDFDDIFAALERGSYGSGPYAGAADAGASAAVPEPSTMLQVLGGLSALAAAVRRRKTAVHAASYG
jgi:hypothetical protein